MTPRQSQFLALLSISPVAPSYDEMKDALGLKSKSSIYRLVNALHECGRIRRLRGRARAIEAVSWPPNGRTVLVPLIGTIPTPSVSP